MALLSVWSEVQMVCIWSRWCHTATPWSLAPVKSRLLYISGACLPRFSWTKDVNNKNWQVKFDEIIKWRVQRESATMKLTHMNASSRTLLMIVHKLIDGSSVSGQIMLQPTPQQPLTTTSDVDHLCQVSQVTHWRQHGLAAVDWVTGMVCNHLQRFCHREPRPAGSNHGKEVKINGSKWVVL